MRTGLRSASEDPCGVDVRFDSRSRGVPAQHLMSLLNVVALLDQHSDGSIEHRQFSEAGQPGHARDRWKISVELDHFSVTVHTRPTMIRVIRGGRSPVNGDAPEGVAQVGGEIGERAGVPAKKTTRLSPSTIRETSPRGRRSDVPTGTSWPSVKAVSVTGHWFSTIVSWKPQ